eukprot:5173775-Heterocapsa_arctica.AAC.1
MRRPGRSRRKGRTCGYAVSPRRWTWEDRWTWTSHPRKYFIILCRPTRMGVPPTQRTTGCEDPGGAY